MLKISVYELLLQMGPFVDSEHPQIKLGVIDRTFHQIFQEEIRTQVRFTLYAQCFQFHFVLKCSLTGIDISYFCWIKYDGT